MRKISKKYRQRDYPTDVLSFVYDETAEDGRQFPGEILIAPHVAVRNAARYRNHPENEIRKLLVHGILHLFRYDHDTDDGSMHLLQRRLTSRVFFKKGESVLKRNKAYP
jgi:probable rRNA maturation factor